jgi:hypothetical protein
MFFFEDLTPHLKSTFIFSLIRWKHYLPTEMDVVDTMLPLSQASQAYEGAKGVHKHGKIVLRVR